MDALSFNSEPSPPPSPKSAPPSCPDLYGKRRQLAKVQFLEREIAMLEEELKSIEGLQVASRCCKELDDFIEARADPLLAIDQKTSRLHFSWKRFWRNFDLKRIWCFHGHCIHLEGPICCSRDESSRSSSCCLEKSCPNCSCLHCCCCGFWSCFSRSPKVKLCSGSKACCNPCSMYY